MTDSGIYKTDVHSLKSEVCNLIEILDLNVLKSENILKKKCPNIVKTSPTLFKYIVKNYDHVRYNDSAKKQFHININKMFDLIIQIQECKISQYDASVIIGQMLGEQYLPKNL